MGLFRFLFKGEVTRPIKIRRVTVRDEGQEPEPMEGGHSQQPLHQVVRVRLIAVLSITLAAVLIILVLGAVGLAALGRDIPGFVSPTLSAIVGYFGGALSTFFGIQREET
jgi:uncharacterized RDD family membrane protein YckC